MPVKRFLLLQVLWLAPIITLCQDLNGFWKGTLTIAGCFPQNHIELQITISGNEILGNSYHYQDVYNYVKKNFRGSYDASIKTLTLKEGSVTTWHLPDRCVICVKEYQLVYSRQGDKETLSGGWYGHIINTPVGCGPGSIVLTRIKESAFKEIPEIKVDTGTIKLDFYDNAEIDGDSITVLVNKQVVLTHQLLTAKPATTYVTVDLKNPFVEVEMIAENLGSIPPNTALLVVTAGKKQYELFLTSSVGKSAMVRFIYEKADEASNTKDNASL